MCLARPSQTYFVHYLDYTFFKNFENIPGNFGSLRPGKRVGDATVHDIRGLMYDQNGVKYKIRHIDAWETIPQRRGKRTISTAAGSLYTEPEKLSSLNLIACNLSSDICIEIIICFMIA